MLVQLETCQYYKFGLSERFTTGDVLFRSFGVDPRKFKWVYVSSDWLVGNINGLNGWPIFTDSKYSQQNYISIIL